MPHTKGMPSSHLQKCCEHLCTPWMHSQVSPEAHCSPGPVQPARSLLSWDSRVPFPILTLTLVVATRGCSQQALFLPFSSAAVEKRDRLSTKTLQVWGGNREYLYLPHCLTVIHSLNHLPLRLKYTPPCFVFMPLIIRETVFHVY